MRVLLSSLALCAIATPALGQEAAEPVVAPGDYRDFSNFETFHGLRINADGTYEWAVSAGAMDRRSAGTWEARDGYLELTTTPTPVAPEIIREEDDNSAGAPFLMVLWPDGRGIFGVDFTLACENGKRISHYTQEEGWNLVPGECDNPQNITMEHSVAGVEESYFNLEDVQYPTGIRFTLVPNDIGVIDLTGTRIMPSADGMTMVWMDNPIEMVRVDED